MSVLSSIMVNWIKMCQRNVNLERAHIWLNWAYNCNFTKFFWCACFFTLIIFFSWGSKSSPYFFSFYFWKRLVTIACTYISLLIVYFRWSSQRNCSNSNICSFLFSELVWVFLNATIASAVTHQHQHQLTV